jgi:membrane protease YdiL (CAAX protease family)
VSRFSHPSQSALLEVGILFLPAIPAYLWLWPVLKGLHSNVFQVLAYVYVLVGTLCIGRRRWSWLQLGLSSQGFRLTLVSGMALLAGRLAIMRGIDWSVQPPSFSWLRWLGNLLFYFGLVGLVEELLFRGLLFRLLADWRGTRWAIWGSSFAFMLWHVFGQGLLVGLVTLLIGLLFALIRWRAGGILGLILLHGLWDLQTVWLVADSNAAILKTQDITFSNLAMVWGGTVLLLLVPLYLWWVHPRLAKIVPWRA